MPVLRKDEDLESWLSQTEDQVHVQFSPLFTCQKTHTHKRFPHHKCSELFSYGQSLLGSLGTTCTQLIGQAVTQPLKCGSPAACFQYALSPWTQWRSTFLIICYNTDHAPFIVREEFRHFSRFWCPSSSCSSPHLQFHGHLFTSVVSTLSWIVLTLRSPSPAPSTGLRASQESINVDVLHEDMLPRTSDSVLGKWTRSPRPRPTHPSLCEFRFSVNGTSKFYLRLAWTSLSPPQHKSNPCFLFLVTPLKLRPG